MALWMIRLSPDQPVHAHRPDDEGDRPLGSAHPEGLRRQGRPRLRRRLRRAVDARRAARGRVRPAPRRGGPRRGDRGGRGPRSRQWPRSV